MLMAIRVLWVWYKGFWDPSQYEDVKKLQGRGGI